MTRRNPNLTKPSHSRRFRPNRTPVAILTAQEFDEMIEEQLLQYADAVDAFAKGDEDNDPTVYYALEDHFGKAHENLKGFIKRLAKIS